MVQAYILVQTEVGKAADVAKQIAAISGVTQAEDVTGHLVKVPVPPVVKTWSDPVQGS